MALITFVVAFCSIAYELLLSATASILLGGTFYRYIITIGLYIFCLGMGSLFVGRFPEEKHTKYLFKIEILLSLFGSLAVVLPLYIDGLGEGESGIAVSFVVYFMVIIIGVLSGMELPLLMALSEKEKERGQMRSLAIDFAATFLGIVIFPTLLLPNLGVFQTAVLVSFLNAVIVLRLYFMLERKKTKLLIAFAILFFLFCSINIFWADDLIQRVFS